MLIKRQSKIKFSISNFQFPKNFGFTLVELLVVIAIIAILSAVLMANFMGARERAKDAQKINDLNALKSALRMYYNDHQAYPPNGSLDVLVGGSYVASITNIGYTYTSTNDDAFVLCVGLEAGAGDEDIDSQKKCGITPQVNKIFAVCAN